jgi:uncharacterized protein YbcV (DUF1398 family)
MSCEPDEVTNTIYYVLTTKQIRALASQQKIVDWGTKDIGTLKRELLKIAETKDILGGEEA